MRKWIAFLLTAVLLCGLNVTALAYEVPDLSQTGSISVTLRYDGSCVGGGTLTLYQVDEVAVDDGNYSFTPAGAFIDCGERFENVESAALAEKLADYADSKGIQGETKDISKNGEVTFRDLELGLYLLVQKDAANGYQAAAPFLVTVPQTRNGFCIYDVEAGPQGRTDESPG